MIDRPAFHAHITPRVVDDNTVELIMEDEGEARLLSGPACGLITRSIDGSRTIDQIADAVREHAGPEAVYYTLAKFEAAGYLTSADSELPPAVRAYWAKLGANPETAVSRLRSSGISVCSIGGIDARGMEAALSDAGIAIRPDASFRIVLTDDYLNPELHEVNRQALSDGAVWMIGNPLGTTQWIGPIFCPGATGCWCCLEHRLAENRGGVVRRSGSGLSTTMSAAFHLMAAEAAKRIVFGKSDSLDGTLRTIGPDLNVGVHRLVRRPQCGCCGEPAVGPMRAPELRQRAWHPSGPALRTETARQTLGRLKPHVSPITGIIPAVKRISTDADPGVVVYSALWNRSLQSGSRVPGATSIARGAMGKGATDVEAEVACLGEAVERYSSSFRGDEHSIQAAMSDLVPNAIPPQCLLNFSIDQYRSREDWNEQHGPFQRIPVPFDDSREVHWTEVWSLTNRTRRYVPTAFCFMGCNLEEEGQFFPSDSNGCASGNCIEEAILHGLLELIERDSVALWWYNRARRPAVDLSSIADPVLSNVQARLRRSGRKLNVLDITTDIDIPAFAAVSCLEDGTEVLLGSGAALDPLMAVTRAAFEVSQMIESIAQERDTPAPPHARDLLDWLHRARIHDHSYLVPSGVSERVTRSAGPIPGVLESIHHCVFRLEQCGLEVLILDMTRADVGFPTVRVIVPGLRHFWARLGPGRLYDVPPQIGWTDKPLAESDLNPIPYML